MSWLGPRHSVALMIMSATEWRGPSE